MDLSTTYLGLPLQHPIVASAGPLSQTLEGAKGLVEGGAAAVVLYSLFEEELRAESARQAQPVAEPSVLFPGSATQSSIARDYLQLLEQSVSAVDVPVIASLNGADIKGWVKFGKELADAGAAALELNVYAVPGGVHLTDDDILQRQIDVVQQVSDAVPIPVSVKMSPYYTSPGHAGLEFVHAGAQGVVMFNRFLQPDIDIDTLEPEVDFELSSSYDGRVPRTWIAILRRYTEASLAGSTGLHTPEDLIKYLLAGADVVMSTSALIKHGREYTSFLLNGLSEWMVSQGFDRISDFQGRACLPGHLDAHGKARQGYVAALQYAKQRYGSL